MDMNKGTDINVGSIEEDIKRCEKLTKPQNANWIGISNQIAIAHVIERIKELEAKLEFYQWGDLDNLKFEEYMKEFIAKQKVKDKFNKLITRIKEFKEPERKKYFSIEQIIDLLEQFENKLWEDK